MDINPQTANFSDYGKQVRVLRGDVSQFDDVMSAMAMRSRRGSSTSPIGSAASTRPASPSAQHPRHG